MASLKELVTLTGKSGTKYQFHAYTIDEECPNEAGIYSFAKRTVTPPQTLGAYKPIYIGMAQSFQKRFYDHHKKECAVKNGANAILLLNVVKESDRKAFEEDLLKAYNCPCNQVNN